MRPLRFLHPPFQGPPQAAGPAAALVLAALVVAGAGCVDSRDSVREVRTASALDLAGVNSLRVETRSADVHFVQSQDDTLRVVTTRRVQARRERTVEDLLSQIKVTMEHQGDQLVLRVREPERGRTHISVDAGPWRYRRAIEIDLTIAVPARVRIEGETSRGDFDAVGLAQAISLVSTSGDIELSQMTGESRVQSTSGDITLRDLAQAVVRVTAGDLDAVEVKGPLTVRATSGDLSAQQIHGNLRLETSTGDVEVHGVEGSVFISTSAGEVEVTAADCDSCVIETASGDITARVVSAPRLVQVRSSSGSVDLDLPPGAGGTLDLQTASGSMQVKSAVNVETMNRNRLSGRLGGSGTVAVRTSSGDITLAASEGVTP
jgi:putative adhesin